ncbi:Phenylalanine 4-monooxygenase [Pseudomonas caricapapayae]|uniref:Phenylalanine-4-hydroxylase n=2 Tax=Pseudomonas caricapapayae TaxID=46678 RepID=A0A3M6FIH3_9PSED|nr:Phenylalanine 4-monooxygenase [Pseudomonas caricapapayae]
MTKLAVNNTLQTRASRGPAELYLCRAKTNRKFFVTGLSKNTGARGLSRTDHRPKASYSCSQAFTKIRRQKQPFEDISMAQTLYVAREPDASGFIDYTAGEHAVWNTLITRQMNIIQGRACQEYLDGIEQLGLPLDRIPQLGEINKVLDAATGWQVERVPALIPFQTFFELLASKRFPVATFIRPEEELDYLQEPDIFHEIFGHCPLLTNPWFAEFTHTYGKLGLSASKEQRVYLARLYWMTIEFGLIDTPQGRKIYGGGILSSPKEALYSLSSAPVHQPFDPLEAMRTPYRIDILQPLYFVLPNLKRLFDLAHEDIMALVGQGMQLGLHAPRFPPKTKDHAA